MTVHTIPRTPRGDTRSDDVAGTIAVPVDPRAGPTGAVAVAAALARQAGLEVEVMAVPPVGLSAGEEVVAATRAATQAGAPAAHGVELAGPGGVVPAIVERVRASGALLACMATRGRTRTDELRLGSVSAGVVQHSPVPVLLVGPGVRHASGTVRRLVACVDGSQRAAQALSVAARLAQRLDAELVLLRVFRIGDVVDTEQIDALRDLAARVPGPRPRLAVLVDDDPAAAIVRFAGDRGDTIVALGTRGRGILCNAVLGSVARRIARQAACPVLAVPPAAAQPLRDQQRRLLRSQAQAAREKDLSVVSASEPGSTGTAT